MALRKADNEVTQKRKNLSRKEVGQTRTRKYCLTKDDIELFKKALLEKRRELLTNVTEFEDEALKQSRLDASGDLSSMPIHMADLGTDNYEQEFALNLMDSERRLLHEIDDALRRIEEGTYGVCEGTGKPILKARLKAQPWAKYSVEYARKLEEGSTGELE